MCRAMVINYGFSDVGPWSLMDQGSQSPDMIMRMMSRNSISETLQHKIDIAVRKIAAEAYEAALQHIRWAPASSACSLLGGLWRGCLLVISGAALPTLRLACTVQEQP